MNSFVFLGEEVLPLTDVLELVDYEETNPDESVFQIEADRQYRLFLARLADLNAGKPPLPDVPEDSAADAPIETTTPEE